MLTGSCLCGKIKYELKSAPKKVTNCHCSMCKKQHGADFATYGSVPKSDFAYLQGQEFVSKYRSSEHITRTFCAACGSNLEWHGSPEFPEWTSIAIGTLDTPYEPVKCSDIFRRQDV